jgi:hypothetical protein
LSGNPHRCKVASFLIAALSATLLSCTPPQTVAAFAGAAGQAIDGGTPVFRDLYDSCVRRHNDAGEITPTYSFDANAPSGRSESEASACAVFAGERDSLIKLSAVLEDYFQAMQELAQFGASSVNPTAAEAGSGAPTAASLSLAQIDSVSKLSGLLVEAFTSGYQRGRLASLLKSADPHVAVTTQGLEKIVGSDYGSLLDEEERTLKRRYRRAGNSSDAAVILLLDRAYSEDLQELEQRRASATAFVKALREIRDGHSKLAGNAGHLSAQKLGLALQPAISQLQTLTSQMENTAKGTH